MLYDCDNTTCNERGVQTNGPLQGAPNNVVFGESSPGFRTISCRVFDTHLKPKHASMMRNLLEYFEVFKLFCLSEQFSQAGRCGVMSEAGCPKSRPKEIHRASREERLRQPPGNAVESRTRWPHNYKRGRNNFDTLRTQNSTEVLDRNAHFPPKIIQLWCWCRIVKMTLKTKLQVLDLREVVACLDLVVRRKKRKEQD